LKWRAYTSSAATQAAADQALRFYGDLGVVGLLSVDEPVRLMSNYK
jgi:hypothetical protein